MVTVNHHEPTCSAHLALIASSPKSKPSATIDPILHREEPVRPPAHPPNHLERQLKKLQLPFPFVKIKDLQKLHPIPSTINSAPKEESLL
ncbi:hypothetical protein EYC84_004819 [Monilinia fructicola]|uniref:Uncharacterized protein n=1 Tax=Monilinia fructicola TaxID=38448 RepID=A0A5M9K686_MONFR|nr:hypothetical protein EYC84_004819 [Monilinia fructicola]